MAAHHRFLVRWGLATFAGWVLGVSLTAALVGALGIGFGMGLGVGFAQWLVIRKRFGATTQWMWASTVGLALPFIASELVWEPAGMSRRDPHLSLTSWLIMTLLAASGGLLASAWQVRALRTREFALRGWIGAGTVGWTLGAAVPLAFMVYGPHLSNMIAILAGGALLAFVTGLAWMRAMTRADVAAAAAS